MSCRPGASATHKIIAFILLLGLGWAHVAHAAEPVAAFTIINDSNSQAAGRVISFGQMFRKGDVRPSASLSVALAGTSVPWQLNAKSLYPDGSVRHGVLSLQLPAMHSGDELQGAISPASGAIAPVMAPTAPPDLDIVLTFAPGTDHTKTLRARLADVVNAPGTHKTAPWLMGPLVREQRYYGPAMNGIQVVFDVWSPVVGTPHVDVIFHNDSADNGDIDTQTYNVAITLDGRPAWHADNVWHYPHATWHKIISASDAPPRAVPDMRLLREIGAIPNYADIRPDRREAQKFQPQTLDQGAPPLDSAGLTMYMATTGGRADIGPLPSWAVFYLLDPSRENQNTLTATADAAGSVPWHVRDPQTNGPINIDAHPDVWLDGRGQAVPGILARKYYVSDTKWTPDDAHQPSLSYLPYLLTGSQYYRDELAMQAGYVLLAMDPAFRGRGAGILLGSQLRAIAWGMRTLANAAFILPMDDARYFQSKLEGNLQEITRRYITGHELDGAGELKGYIPAPYAVEGVTPPWQDDYLAIILGWTNSMGFAQARPVLDWMTNFVAGRFTNGAHGYDPIYGTPYFLYVKEPATDQFITNWAGAFKRTFSESKPVTALDYPDWGGGYAALARAALASIITTTGSPRAREAYQFVLDKTPGMNANYSKTPVFAIVPARDIQSGAVSRIKGGT
jgi:hypothetical protein